ncbi:MAG: protein phosphatase CheZ [Magnetospirillum sp.]|nr:protein phosphatase CheZ [Magnetospirillum sp.]
MPVKGGDRDLELRLDAIRREHGESVRLDQIAEVVRAMLDTISGDISAADLRLYSELESLADYIHNAKAELAALRPGEIKDQFIATATDELDAIVGATEAATNQILDAMEHLEALAPMMDKDVADRMTEITTQVFEACNFQDITGQRITKVVRVLKEIEARVDSLVAAFGQEVGAASAAQPEPSAPASDADLLNGPQLPASAANQAEIDRLLASFD